MKETFRIDSSWEDSTLCWDFLYGCVLLKSIKQFRIHCLSFEHTKTLSNNFQASLALSAKSKHNKVTLLCLGRSDRHSKVRTCKQVKKKEFWNNCHWRLTGSGSKLQYVVQRSNGSQQNASFETALTSRFTISRWWENHIGISINWL